MKKPKTQVFLLIFLLTYLMLSVLFGARTYLNTEDKALGFVAALFGWLWWGKLLLAASAASLAVLMMDNRKLNIKAERVGDGQHGDARWSTREEIAEAYRMVGFGREQQPGFLVGLEENCWMVDAADNNLLLLAPPGSGKTTSVYIPTLKYNGLVNENTCGKGASFIAADIKGTLYSTTAPEMKRCGYRTCVLNLRDVFTSLCYNVMYRVNEEIDLYKAANSKKEKAIHYGAAERYAKIVASAIIDAAEKTMSSEGSEYFNETAKGLVIGLVLLVSEFAEEKARHILSVFDLLIQLNGVAAEEGANTLEGGSQKSKVELMLEKSQNKRIRTYVGAATSADSRTMMNVFSSAMSKLQKFIDAELEQLMCKHSPELDARKFIEQPTIVYIICPDENPTRHFLVSLFIRTMTDELIEIAESEYGGEMPRQFFYLLDEFGNIPAIQHVASLFSAIRSRGGRVMIALQSYAQLLESYSSNISDIIKDTCQVVMNSYLAPSSEKTASSLSKMLGNETVLSGSSSVSRGVVTASSQMVGKALLAPDAFITLPKGTFIVQKGGTRPMKTKLKYYKDYITMETQAVKPPQNEYTNVALVSAKLLEVAISGKLEELKKGMFDNG